jgi:hypothetical protein
VQRLGSAPAEPAGDLLDAVEAQLGRRVVRWRKPHTGLTPAQRFVVTLDDGSSVFVKAAVDDETERWLRTDHLVMSTVESSFVPEEVAWIETPTYPVLVIEDLHDAHWPADHFRDVGGTLQPVRWNDGQIDQLLSTLERVAGTTPPASLARLTEDLAHYWPEIANDPAPFLALGLCTPRWFDASLDRLLAAEAVLDLSGDVLVHNDVRSDNVCFRGERVILVDWSDARRGNASHDRAMLLLGLPLEGGPDPYDVMPDAGSFAAWRAGELAQRARTDVATAPRWLIDVFKRLAIIGLQWAARSLCLPRWDGPDWRDV